MRSLVEVVYSIDYLAYVDVIDGVTVGIVEWYGYRDKYDLTKLKDLFQGGNKMPYVSPRQPFSIAKKHNQISVQWLDIDFA